MVRRLDGLLFDEDLPHFHFYGLDIVQTALACGAGAWNVPLPCIHNDGFKGRMDESYDRCFQYIRKKWRAQLPLVTPTVKIAWHGLDLYSVKRQMRRSFDDRKNTVTGAKTDPRIYAERCGWRTV